MTTQSPWLRQRRWIGAALAVVLLLAGLALGTIGQAAAQSSSDVRWNTYNVSLDVADKPGVLATVAHSFAEHDVSISTVRQDGHGDAATLVIVTHSAPDAALSATIAELRDMPAVRGVTSVLRVEGLS